MRVLVISDIHANFTALEAILQHAGEADETWCLGDLVGYGPDPNLVVDQIREIPHLTCLMGNHDAAVIGKIPFETFNNDARRSLERHEQVLTADNMDFLRSLPQTVKVHAGVTLAHGSPRDPLWEYVLNTLSARLNFDQFETPWCFVGHSHIQCMFSYNEKNDRVSLEATNPATHLALHPKMILNPGSVGQPRDRDPRAAYAIYENDARIWQPQRVEYDIPAVQQRIREAGLPEKHAVRLAEGW